MHLIDFPERTITIAADQPEYLPLPAHVVGNEQGEIICCWQLTLKDRFKLLWRGKIFHSVWTFNQPLQPLMLHIDKPPMPGKCNNPKKGRWARMKLAPVMFGDAWEVTGGLPIWERLGLCWTAFWCMLK